MLEFFRLRARSFKYAFYGWWFVLRTQKNAWIHALASILVVILGILLKVSLTDWSLLVLTIGLVWMSEFMNTAIEAVVDLTSPQQHPLARVAKDVAASAVLIAAITSIVVGILVFGPPLLNLLTSLPIWR